MLAAMTSIFVQVYQGGIVCQNRVTAWQTVTILLPRARPTTGRVLLASQTGKVHVIVAVNHSMKISCGHSRGLFDQADE
jgi:hypothetical protein